MTKKWTTWFISDIHFGHNNCIMFDSRPFKDIEDMKEKIIENWNKVVSPEDLGIFVGDIFFYHSKEEMEETLNQMNGRKVLVRGNHDKKPRQMINSGFECCVEEMVLVIANERVLISHYPFRMPHWKYKLRYYVNKIKKKLGWKLTKWLDKYHNIRPVDKGQFLIHGHTHSKDKQKGRQIHVGVTAWDYKPVNIQDITNIINRTKDSEKKSK